MLVAVAGLWLDLGSRQRHSDQTKPLRPETGQQSERAEDQKQNAPSLYDTARNSLVTIKDSVVEYLQRASRYCVQESAGKQDKWLQDFLCGVKITDVVIAVFSVALVFVTVGLVGIGWIQAGLMRRTARRQLRAYVFIHEAWIGNITTPLAWEVATNYKPTGAEITHPHLGPFARLSIKNSGQTPAYDVVHWGEMYFREFPLKSKLPRHPKNLAAFMMTKSSIPPNGTSNKNVLLPSGPLNADQVADLKRGVAALYVDGFIRYRDAFRRRRWTTFRFMCTAFTGGVGITTDLTISGEGNNAN